MPSTYTTELFVKLFGVMPGQHVEKQTSRAPSTEVLVPNKLAEPGGKVIYHVTPRRKDDRWNIKKEGGSRPSAVCDTKDEAVSRAREIARNQGWSRVIVHNRDGKAAQEFNYGERTAAKPEYAEEDWEPLDETDAGMDLTDVPTSGDRRATAGLDKEGASSKPTQRAVWHVTPRAEDGKWRVKRQGSSKPTRVLNKKDEAVAAAKELAKGRKKGQVVIHTKDGKIAEEFKYDS